MTFTIITVTLVLFATSAALVLLCRWLYRSDSELDGWMGIASIFAGIIAVLVFFGALAFPIVQVSNAIVCRNQAANLELPHRYSISAGCYVKFHGQWIGIDKALGIVAQ